MGDNTDLGTTISLNGSVGARRLGVAGTLTVGSGTITQGSGPFVTERTFVQAVTFSAGGGNQDITVLPPVKVGGIVEMYLFDSTNPNAATSSGKFTWMISAFQTSPGNVPSINALATQESYNPSGSSIGVIANNQPTATGLSFRISVPNYSVGFTGTLLIKWTYSSVP
jgi:hypothetical protein